MAAAAGPSSSQGASSIDNSAPLAQIEATESIQFRFQNATIRTLVSVRECPRGKSSRLGYHANLYLTLRDGVERDVGYITGWRISRPSGINPNIDTYPCLSDWYFDPLHSYDEDSKQLAYCVRAIYGKGSIPTRRVSDRVVNAEKREELRDGGNEIVFIETLYIKWRENANDRRTQYSGFGLASVYLEAYYRLLGGKVLPAWFSLDGPVTYLLLPRMHHDRNSPVNEYWRNEQQEEGYNDNRLAEEVETRLKAIFSREYFGFEPYVTDAEVDGAYITVWGRAVEPEDALSIPEDRLLPTS